MGVLGTLIVYGFGKRRGRKKTERSLGRNFASGLDSMSRAGMNPECVNFAVFCDAYGSCDGEVCEFAE